MLYRWLAGVSRPLEGVCLAPELQLSLESAAGLSDLAE